MRRFLGLGWSTLFAASEFALQVQRENEERKMALAGLLGECKRIEWLDRDFCYQLSIGLPLELRTVESMHVSFGRDRRKTLDWAERKERGGVPYPEAVRKMAEESPLYKEGSRSD